MQIKLFPHQQQSLDKTKDFNRVAYYLDMGLGKTFVGSEKMMQMRTSINLVVCQKSKIQDWIDHFNDFYKVQTYDLTVKNNLKEFIRIAYDRDELDPCQYIGVINYDLLFRRLDFLYMNDFTLMLDESSMIQNDTAKRTKFILKLKAKNVILLSGTPTSGKYEHLWSQIHLLGWKISKPLYNKQYVNWKKIDLGGFTQSIVDRDNPYKNVERLKNKMRQHGAVFMKTEECFDLPAQTMIPVKVNTTKEYRKFKNDCVVTVQGLNKVIDYKHTDYWGTAYKFEEIELVGDTTLTKRLYLRQLCGQYNKDKIQAFSDLAASTNDRLIVFYNFNAELEELKKVAQTLNKPISEVNGHCKDLTAYENEDNSITFIQYQAGAMGLNLQKANKIVYFTLTDKSELFEQSKKRIHRIGQDKQCFYYLMMCKNSVEEDIYKSLEMRKDYTDELFKEYDLR